MTLDSQWVSAIASVCSVAVAIAAFFVAWAGYRLTRELEAARNQSQQETADLYKAIVIATILSGPSSFGQMPEALTAFRKHYDGSVQIFRDSGGPRVGGGSGFVGG